MRVLWLSFACVLACDASTPAGVIPPPPDAAATTSVETSTFAVDSLLLGDAARDGGLSNSAWKLFGYDLDGRETTKDSTDVCSLKAGAPRPNQADGVGGIDNAWGSILLVLVELAGTGPNPSADVSARIAAGDWTLLVQVTGLSNELDQTASGLDASAFLGAKTVGAPTFDATWDWPVQASSPRVHFATVYATGGTVVARDPDQPLPLSLVVPIHRADDAGALPDLDLALPLVIHHAVLTFTRSDAATLANGTLAGVLSLDEVVAAADAFGTRATKSLCGSAFGGIADQIADTQDIRDDATNRAGVACDAISIGLGFTAKLVANPTSVGADPDAGPDPCDAGGD